MKPWLADPIPELLEESAKDVCLSKKALCLIYASTGKPNDVHTEALKAAQAKTVSNLDDRGGVSIALSWLNTSTEKEIATTLKVEGATEASPKVVVFKHGKRNKFLTLDGDVTKESIETFVERIISGDAKFGKIEGKSLGFVKGRKYPTE